MPSKFTFYESYWETAQRLDDGDRLAWFDGLTSYVFEGVEPSFQSPLDIVWLNVRPVLDRGLEAIANGAKGGRPKKSAAPSDDGKKGGLNPPKNHPETPLKSQVNTLIISNSRSNSRSISNVSHSFPACPSCGSPVSKLFDRPGHPWLCKECGELSEEPTMRAAL